MLPIPNKCKAQHKFALRGGAPRPAFKWDNRGTQLVLSSGPPSCCSSRFCCSCKSPPHPSISPTQPNHAQDLVSTHNLTRKCMWFSRDIFDRTNHLPSLSPSLFYCSVPRRAGGSRDAVSGRGPQHLPAGRSPLEEALQGQRTHLPGQEVQQGE